jgi:ketosteroid isomerase-like protein
MPSDSDAVVQASHSIAAAIAARDVAALRNLLAPDFVHRTHGGVALDIDAFLHGIEQIPGEILHVVLEGLEVDVCGAGALVTGIQRAEVRVGDTIHKERRGFVDWFVQRAGGWLIQAAVDLPPGQSANGGAENGGQS